MARDASATLDPRAVAVDDGYGAILMASSSEPFRNPTVGSTPRRAAFENGDSLDASAPARPDAKHQLVTQPRGTRDAANWASGTLARCRLAVLAVLGAVGVRRVLVGVLDNSHVPFLFQFVAVLAAAAFGGLGPWLLATALATLGGYFLFVASPGGDHLSAQLIVFALEGCLISALGGWLRWARRRAESGDIARANLEKQMLEIGDKERRRFGHDLHDGLGQQLTGIALMSESLSHRLQASG